MASIATIKQLDVGATKLGTEGKVVYSNPRKHIQGEKNGREYDFYAQFIILEDNNKDSIVVDLIDSQEVNKGDQISVCKGQLKGHTDQHGEATVKLSASLGENQQPSLPDATQAAQNASQSTNAKKEVDWDAKELREKRGYAIRDATQLVCTLAEVIKQSKSLNAEVVKQVAEVYVNYVYNGPTNAQEARKEMADEFDKRVGPGPNNIPHINQLRRILVDKAVSAGLLNAARDLMPVELERLHKEILTQHGRFPTTNQDVEFLYETVRIGEIFLQ